MEALSPHPMQGCSYDNTLYSILTRVGIGVLYCQYGATTVALKNAARPTNLMMKDFCSPFVAADLRYKNITGFVSHSFSFSAGHVGNNQSQYLSLPHLQHYKHKPHPLNSSFVKRIVRKRIVRNIII